MRTIPLTKGYCAVVDAEDYDRVSRFKWHARVDKNTIYAGRVELTGGRRVQHLLHRDLLGALPGIEVDHRDRNGLNCRRDNLRFATHAQNQRNSERVFKRKKASKYRGVTWEKAPACWRARARFSGKCHDLGLFVDEQEAARAYDDCVAKLYGEFVRFNFPERQDCTRAVLQERITMLEGTIDALTNRD